MTVKDFKNLRVKENGSVHWVIIDRPVDRNSLDSETIEEIEVHLHAAEAREVRAIVYRGSGEEHFIGGADGVEMFRFDERQARTFSSRLQALFDRMEESPVVLIAAIDGLCFGGGLEFALACDFRIATTRSRLGLPEVRLGIIPGAGGTQRLPRVIGLNWATEMILLGQLQPAERALAWGLVHDVVPPDKLEERVQELIGRILRLPAFAVTAAKRALYATQRLPLGEGLRIESDLFAHCFRHSYFANVIQEQLASGRLKTTKSVEGIVDGHGSGK